MTLLGRSAVSLGTSVVIASGAWATQVLAHGSQAADFVGYYWMPGAYAAALFFPEGIHSVHGAVFSYLGIALSTVFWSILIALTWSGFARLQERQRPKERR